MSKTLATIETIINDGKITAVVAISAPKIPDVVNPAKVATFTPTGPGVIEATAKKQQLPSDVMYQRLKAQDLIRQRLLQHYESLHTQSLEWVVEDTIETLHNWEQEGKE